MNVKENPKYKAEVITARLSDKGIIKTNKYNECVALIEGN